MKYLPNELCHCVAYCQKEAEEQRTTPGRKPKQSKPKLGKSTKSPRAVTTKPKVKATPAAPPQTFLTQVYHLVQNNLSYVKSAICKMWAKLEFKKKTE